MTIILSLRFFFLSEHMQCLVSAQIIRGNRISRISAETERFEHAGANYKLITKPGQPVHPPCNLTGPDRSKFITQISRAHCKSNSSVFIYKRGLYDTMN
jgi:hypothetical protein